MDTPSVEQQKATLHMKCEMEVFCPRCHAPLSPEFSVMVQQIREECVAATSVSCWRCYDEHVKPVLHGMTNNRIEFENGYTQVSDGRELFASELQGPSDAAPTADP